MNTAPTAATLIEQGLLHHRQGQLALAMDRYTEVLRRDPGNADALYYVAVVACAEGQYQEGIDLARRSLSFREGQARAHNLIGQALDRLGKPLEAIKSLDQAIAIDPKLAAAHGNRANILVDAGMAQEALKSFDRAIALDPQSSPDLVNRGALLFELGRPEEALASYDQALVCDPGAAEVHANRANVLKEIGQMDLVRGQPDTARFDEAVAAYDRAIELNANLDEAYTGRGVLKLARGEWPAGFADYEHRTESGTKTFEPLPEPRWDGSMHAGERLVLVAEQGLGDTIQFCRFAPVLAGRGFDVTLLVRKSMAPLLSSLPGVSIATDAGMLAADKRPLRWAPLLSVPFLLGTTLDTLPRETPYLSADPKRVQSWAERLGTGTFKIGINWASGHSTQAHFARRDIPLHHFAALAALPGVELVPLQNGPAKQQISGVAFRDKIKVVDADRGFDADSFVDTAAVMNKLDLVVTCDTSVAHLAGALARPVFTALPVISDWRWMLRREESPWYPTMRLFRQGASRQWDSVFQRITAAVRELMDQTGQPGT